MSTEHEKVLLATFSNFEIKHRDIICYVYGLIASMSFTTSNFLVKSLSNLTSMEILYFRSLLLFIFTMGWMEHKDMAFYFNRLKVNRLLLTRGSLGLLAMSLNYYGIGYLPLSEASVILQCSPVVIGVLGALILKDKYELPQFFGALFCMVGVLLVAKPAFIFGTNEDTSSQLTQKWVGVVSLLTGTFFIGTTQILVKIIGSQTNEGAVTLYFAGIASILAPLVSLIQGFNSYSMNNGVTLLFIGIFSFMEQISRNRAYILGQPGKVSLTAYFGIIYSMFLDVFFLGTELDMYSVMGAMCIFGSLFIFLYQTIKKERQTK